MRQAAAALAAAAGERRRRLLSCGGSWKRWHCLRLNDSRVDHCLRLDARELRGGNCVLSGHGRQHLLMSHVVSVRLALAATNQPIRNQEDPEEQIPTRDGGPRAADQSDGGDRKQEHCWAIVGALGDLPNPLSGSRKAHWSGDYDLRRSWRRGVRHLGLSPQEVLDASTRGILIGKRGSSYRQIQGDRESQR